MNSADWQIWIAECRRQEPKTMVRRLSGCRAVLGLPMLRIKNHPLIRMSDVERYGMAMNDRQDIPTETV